MTSQNWGTSVLHSRVLIQAHLETLSLTQNDVVWLDHVGGQTERTSQSLPALTSMTDNMDSSCSKQMLNYFSI